MSTVLAISGVKNSGKTTLIEQLLQYLRSEGLTVATVKHDGHDFDADVKGTDTYRHLQAGALGTAIFSKNKYMMVRYEEVDESIFLQQFEDMDLILLEGFKYSDYPKLEIVRAGNSTEPVCKEPVVGIVSNLELKQTQCPVFHLDDITAIGQFIINYVEENKHGKNYGSMQK